MLWLVVMAPLGPISRSHELDLIIPLWMRQDMVVSCLELSRTDLTGRNCRSIELAACIWNSAYTEDHNPSSD